MEDRFRNRRRNYYIKKEFQRNFIFKFSALVALGALISGAVIYYMSKSTVTTTFVNSRLAIKSTADFILPAVLLSSAVVFILIGLATVAVTLFTSHKIAGPLYRLEKDLGELIAGNLGITFSLRKSDEIKPIAVTLNILTQTLKTHVTLIKKAVDELEAKLNASCKDIPPEAKAKLENLKKEIAKFKI